MSADEFIQFKGVGLARASVILAAAELGNRRKWDSAQRKCVKSSQQAFEFLAPLLVDLNHERFYILLLNRANRVLATRCISTGGVAGTVVDPKIVFKKALERDGCNALILAHNHPSGRISPSDADKRITEKLCGAGRMLDLKVLDHIIVGEGEYFSFADEGIMP